LFFLSFLYSFYKIFFYTQMTSMSAADVEDIQMVPATTDAGDKKEETKSSKSVGDKKEETKSSFVPTTTFSVKAVRLYTTLYELEFLKSDYSFDMFDMFILWRLVFSSPDSEYTCSVCLFVLHHP